MKTIIHCLTKYSLIAVVALAAAQPVFAQSDAPYTAGGVWLMSMVRTKTGRTDDYMKNLGNAFRPVMEEAKKQHAILDYKVLLGDSANAQDFDVLLMVEYPNMAAMDTMREKMDPILKKIVGGEDDRRKAKVDRGEVREILGDKTMREVTLK